MKILLTAIGSTGDILPFVALAEALKKAGHSVKVCSYNVYKSHFDKINIPFAAVGPALDLDKVGAVRDRLKRLSPFKQLDFLVNDVFLQEGEKFYNDFLVASQGYHFGVCHSLDFIGQQVMMENRLPWASVIICPGVIPTAYAAPMHVAKLGHWGNRLSWKLLGLVKGRVEKKIEDLLFGLNGIRRNINVIGTFSPHLNLVAASEFMGKTYPDLPNNFTVTGPWWVPENHYQPPGAIETFTSAGKADVVFTLGSMGRAEGISKKSLFMVAAQKAGVRAIIQKSWPGEMPDDLPDDMLIVDYKMPFHYLFRQARVVVHLANSGTSIAACKAGAASVTVPHLVDQRYWAAMLYEQGVSRRPLPPKKLTPDRLAAEIRAALDDAVMAERAAALREAMQNENGTANAVKAIENFVYSIKE
ncbi:MAG: glycosyltransferase [Calditrichaeota bacterium]|nr:glycosyltransferase [Calditrichota bacterium]